MASGKELVKQVDALDDMAGKYELAAVDEDAGPFKRALMLSSGIMRLRKALAPEILEQVMSLQNTQLGFRTDNPSGYPVETVRDCLIEATMRGARPVGNEMNIISGKCYLTKEYFLRAVRTFPGLTDLKDTMSIPQIQGQRAVVEFKAAWKLKGKVASLEREIPIRVNQGMSDDAILGKATRKGYALILQRLTGSEQSLPEGEVEEVPRRSAPERATIEAVAKVSEPDETPKKKRGRPPGAKNKPKDKAQLLSDLQSECSAAWTALAKAEQIRVVEKYEAGHINDVVAKIQGNKEKMKDFLAVCKECKDG